MWQIMLEQNKIVDKIDHSFPPFFLTSLWYAESKVEWTLGFYLFIVF